MALGSQKQLSVLCFCFPLTDPDLWISRSLSCWLFLKGLHPSPQLAGHFQVCRVQPPQSLVTWEHSGKVCGMNAGGGGRRQAAVLSCVITPQKPDLSIFTKSLALSSCCPPLPPPPPICLCNMPRDQPRGWRPPGAPGSGTIISSEDRVVCSLCCSSLPTAMVPEQQPCFSGCTSILI